jgi:hypothetical protein
MFQLFPSTPNAGFAVNSNRINETAQPNPSLFSMAEIQTTSKNSGLNVFHGSFRICLSDSELSGFCCYMKRTVKRAIWHLNQHPYFSFFTLTNFPASEKQ